MIRNIVFDMGNVLIHFDPELFVNRLSLPRADRDALLEAVFRNPLWAALDRGTASEGDAYEDMCRRLPGRLHEAAWALLHWWHDLLPMEGMEALLRELKGLGYGLYTLSNAPVNLHLYFPDIPGSECMDGLVVSADFKLLKPRKELFEVLLNRYHLNGDECFFIDDTLANVEGAKTAGLHGTVFTGNVEKLREDLRNAGVPVD